MYELKGFMSLRAYINNAPGQLSRLGELSGYSRTYGTDIQELAPAANNELLLHAFHSKQDGITTTVPGNLAEQAFGVVSNLLVYPNTHTQPFDLDEIKATVQLLASNQLEAVELGALNVVAGKLIPDWIEYTTRLAPIGGIKLWLNDAAFQAEYDESIMVVIPPVNDIDLLLKDSTIVRNALSANTAKVLTDKIRLAKQGYPETDIVTLTIPLVSPTLLEPINTDWTIIVYGTVGDPDNYKQAIIDYIRTSSTQSLVAWEQVLPSLLQRNEFILMPLWDNIAVDDLSAQRPIRSVTTSPMTAISAYKALVDLPITHIERFIESSYVTYNYTAFLACSGTSNKIALQSIKHLFADYLPTASDSVDYMRMNANTRAWKEFLEELIIAADEQVVLPSPAHSFKVTKRYNKRFFIGTFNEVQYLALARIQA